MSAAKDPADLDVRPGNRVLIGFTWYWVWTVDGNKVKAGEPGRYPYTFDISEVREVRR